MTCQERRDLLLLYVTGTLEPAEMGEMRTHLLGGCPACAGALAEAEATVHRIPESLPPVKVPPGAWEKIEKRIGVAEQAAPARVEATSGKVFIPWFVAAAAMIGVAVLGMTLYVQGRHVEEMRAQLVKSGQALEAAQGYLKEAGNALTETRARVANLEQQMKSMGDDNKKLFASLEQAKQNYVGEITRLMHADQYAVSPAQDKGAKGTLFWNKGDGTWTLMASNLAPLPVGRTYELWIVTASGEKLAAGTFEATASGTAMHEIKLPADVGAIQLAAVTDEPASGVTQPTGQIQFLSDVTKKQ